mgnify:CR=1 FL=1
MSAPQSYYVPVDAGEAEFTEKRSRFLGHVRRVETEAEARAFLDEMRKKYYDARHNCWCYLIREGGIVGDCSAEELEESGRDLMGYIKETYHYRPERVSQALDALTDGEEGEDA